jgi:enoyl-[acyl-carrier protein] reductase I
MGLLESKRILVTGVLTDDSLAFSVARIAQEQGAEIVLTGAGRGMGLTQRMARRLPAEPEVLELDVTSPEQAEAVRSRLAEKWGEVDGVLHAIGFAPPSCLGGGFMDAPWDDVAVALQISAYSLKVLADVVVPVMGDAGGSIVGLDFDNSRQAWPAYDWMGVAKSAFESCARYMAKELGPRGVRVNLVAAGPIKTVAARSIAGFAKFEDVWDERAPLGWNVKGDQEAVGRACVALLSDWFPKTTGEVVHVDGGFHAVGA